MRKFQSLRLSVLALMVFVFSLAIMPATSFAATSPTTGGTPPKIVCGGIPNTFSYVDVVNEGISRVDVSPELFYNNTTSTTVTKTWSETISANVTVTASGQVSPEAGVIFDGVKAQVNAGVSFSITGTFTDSITYNIPPGKSIGVTYGVTQQVAYGEYLYTDQSCRTHDEGPMTSWSPWRVEWLQVAGNL